MLANHQDLDTLIAAQVSGLVDTIPALSGHQDRLESILRTYATKAIKSIDQGKDLAQKVGPSIWIDMHYRAKVADDEGKAYIYEDFLTDLMDSHPCQDCREHMAKNLQQVPIDRYPSSFAHSVALHNAVNSMLGKPQMSLSEANTLYDIGCSTCSFSSQGKQRNDIKEAQSGARVAAVTGVYPHSRGYQNYGQYRGPYRYGGI